MCVLRTFFENCSLQYIFIRLHIIRTYQSQRYFCNESWYNYCIARTGSIGWQFQVGFFSLNQFIINRINLFRQVLKQNQESSNILNREDVELQVQIVSQSTDLLSKEVMKEHNFVKNLSQDAKVVKDNIRHVKYNLTGNSFFKQLNKFLRTLNV